MDNLNDVLKKFHITASGLGEEIGENRVWMSQRLCGAKKWQPGDLERIEKKLREMGKELAKVKLK